MLSTIKSTFSRIFVRRARPKVTAHLIHPKPDKFARGLLQPDLYEDNKWREFARKNEQKAPTAPLPGMIALSTSLQHEYRYHADPVNGPVQLHYQPERKSA
jgi:hypothetical protein